MVLSEVPDWLPQYLCDPESECDRDCFRQAQYIINRMLSDIVLAARRSSRVTPACSRCEDEAGWGYTEGHADGYTEGFADGQRQASLLHAATLNRCGACNAPKESCDAAVLWCCGGCTHQEHVDG